MAPQSQLDGNEPLVAGESAGLLNQLDAIKELSREITSRAGEFETMRRIPADLAHKLARAGLFRTLVPKDFGGAEMKAHEYVRVIQELSRADGSAGWCVMIGSLGAALAAWLPEATAREIFGIDPDVITGGAVAAVGKSAPG